MPKPLFPAACLPQAAVPVTIVWIHPDYDSTAEVRMVARDWASRGDSYLRRIADLDEHTRIIAVFPGRLRSGAGEAVNA